MTQRRLRFKFIFDTLSSGEEGYYELIYPRNVNLRYFRIESDGKLTILDSNFIDLDSPTGFIYGGWEYKSDTGFTLENPIRIKVKNEGSVDVNFLLIIGYE